MKQAVLLWTAHQPGRDKWIISLADCQDHSQNQQQYLEDKGIYCPESSLKMPLSLQF